MKFDNINLNDDFTSPKLDLDFGLDDSKEKKSGSGGFSFGGSWGGGWGGTNNWGFGGLDDKKDSKAVEEPGWGAVPTTSKKAKDKKNDDFNFGFGGLGGEEDQVLDLGVPAKAHKAVEEDAW